MFNFIRMLIIGLLLSLMALPAVSETETDEPELCGPFMDGRVDEDLLSGMLSAAEDGSLYRIQPGSSQVGFCVNSKLSRVEGNFTKFRGGMSLGNSRSNNGQTLVMIRADSLETEGALVRSLLKGESFFDVEHYPDVLFVSTAFEWTGKKTALLKGDLTLRGITRPIVFDVTLTPADAGKAGKPGRMLVKATATINRAEFGMDALQSVVEGEVQLCMTVEAQQYESISARERQRSPVLAEVVAPVPVHTDRTPG